MPGPASAGLPGLLWLLEAAQKDMVANGLRLDSSWQRLELSGWQSVLCCTGSLCCGCCKLDKVRPKL